MKSGRPFSRTGFASAWRRVMRTAKPPIIGPDSARHRSYREVQLLLAGVMTVLGGLILFLFDPTRYPFYPVCAFHQVTGLLCPGCGSLRAMHQLLHGNLATAFHFNPLLVVTLPIAAAYFAYCYSRRATFSEPFHAVHGKWWWVFFVLALAFTVWRNIPGSTYSAVYISR